MDKRKSVRCNKEFSVSYKVHQGGDFTETVCLVKDCSLEGMKLSTTQWLNPKAVLEFIITKPLGKDQITVLGKVIDCERDKEKGLYSSRVSFIQLDEKTKDKLADTLEEIRWYKKKNF